MDDNTEQLQRALLLETMKRGIIAPESISFREISEICKIAALYYEPYITSTQARLRPHSNPSGRHEDSEFASKFA